MAPTSVTVTSTPGQIATLSPGVPVLVENVGTVEVFVGHGPSAPSKGVALFPPSGSNPGGTCTKTDAAASLVWAWTASGTGTVVVDPDSGSETARAMVAEAAAAIGNTAIDSTASDIQPLGTRAAGAVGLVADAGHVHPLTGVAGTINWSQSKTGLAPSATLNTYGTATTWAPDAGYAAILLRGVNVTSSGTFGSETLTVKVTATFSDSTTANVTKTFTAAGVSADLSVTDIANLFKDGVKLSSLAVAAESSLAAGSSIATAAVVAFGWNGN